jgi:hypothetical protein
VGSAVFVIVFDVFESCTNLKEFSYSRLGGTGCGVFALQGVKRADLFDVNH